ncbi:hypothetical protein [Mucilaginibacter phyllosphaerae]
MRKLYIELEPTSKGVLLQFRKMADFFLSMPGGNPNLSTIALKLMETRNKLAHGVPLGIDDADEIRNATRNISRLRAELNEIFTFHIIRLQLEHANIKRTMRGGFDFLAELPGYQIAFEVRSPVNGRLEQRAFNELADKYSNYVTINHHRLFYALFIFQPRGRKSLDSGNMQLEQNMRNSLPDIQSYITVQYITSANDRNIREQIEEVLNKVTQDASRPSETGR